MRNLKMLEKSRNYGLFVGLRGGVIVYLFSNLGNVLTVHGIHLQWGIILGLAVVLTQFRESSFSHAEAHLPTGRQGDRQENT